MKIENIISNKELEQRFKALCNSNWKVKNMARGLHGDTKYIIDNWFEASRSNFLKLLEIKENENYKFVYHSIKPQK